MYHASVAGLKISRFLLRLFLLLLLLILILLLLLVLVLLTDCDVTSRTGAYLLPRRLFLYLVLSFQSATMWLTWSKRTKYWSKELTPPVNKMDDCSFCNTEHWLRACVQSDCPTKHCAQPLEACSPCCSWKRGPQPADHMDGTLFYISVTRQ